MIKITLLDGSVKEYEKAVSPLNIAKDISISLAKKVVGSLVDGKLFDLNKEIKQDAQLALILEGSDEGLDILRHSAAHIMAQAVLRIYPEALVTIGPTTDEGFYYDIDYPLHLDDLSNIEKEMKKIIAQGFDIIYEEITKDQALELFKDNPYKVEIINELDDKEIISIYKQGEFVDLCRGTHLLKTGKLKHFKLLSLAGSYWRGDSKNKMLNRIYGTAFFTAQELDDYMQLLEERKERDHRKIAKDLKLFTINELAGKGLPMFLPNGATIRRELERYIVDKELANDYQHVYTSCLGTVDLYKTSGHFEHYKDDMFPVMDVDDNGYVLRPMCCPHHMLIFGSDLRSYKDLPIRITELGTLHRFEKSGALIGLERVRGMCLNDSHIFIAKDQIKEEFTRVINFIQDVYQDLNIKAAYYRLSLRGEDKEKYYDDDSMWETSQSILKETLDELHIDYVEAKDEAAFYGPKLDIQVKTALNHDLTLSTIQLDFLLPQKFNLSFINKDGEKETPVVIHRGVTSTSERFIAYLIEEYKGAFPTFLAPTQVNVIPVSLMAHTEYAKEIVSHLKSKGIRVLFDQREEKLGYKMRESIINKIPYTIIIGDDELNNKKVTYKTYKEQINVSTTLENFVDLIKTDIANKSKNT